MFIAYNTRFTGHVVGNRKITQAAASRREIAIGRAQKKISLLN